ncbi:hypothetical protein WYI_08659, partial [Ochrobactrum sp. CDB2]
APCAANSIAVARPIPDDAPIMIATLSFKLDMETSLIGKFRNRCATRTQLSVSCDQTEMGKDKVSVGL